MAKVGASPAANLLLITSPCNSILEFPSDADGWQTVLMATLHRVPSSFDFVNPSLYAEYPRNGLNCCAAACCVPEEEDDHGWEKNVVSTSRGVRYGLTDDVHVSLWTRKMGTLAALGF
jgi:hypothetical protein